MATQTPMQSVASQPAAPPRLPASSAGFRAANPASAGAALGESPIDSGSQARPPAGQTGLMAGAATARNAVAEGEFHTVAGAAERQRGPTGESTGLNLSAQLERMPVGLNVAIPVRGFRVRNLLAIEAGEVIETQWANGEDLPLSSGEVQLAWSEFEVVDTRLAVRVTRLA